eukprot:SAG25_NODE_2644_length_1472_cov_1.610342_2_plen_99_part_00
MRQCSCPAVCLADALRCCPGPGFVFDNGPARTSIMGKLCRGIDQADVKRLKSSTAEKLIGGGPDKLKSGLSFFATAPPKETVDKSAWRKQARKISGAV